MTDDVILQLLSSTGPLGTGLLLIWIRLERILARVDTLEARVTTLEAGPRASP